MPKIKYYKPLIIEGIKYCRIEDCKKTVLKGRSMCSMHVHRDRKQRAIQKLFKHEIHSNI